MGKYVAIIGGLIAMVVSIILLVVRNGLWDEFKVLVFGCIPPILFLGGFIAIIAGISSIKDAMRTKKLEEETKEEEKKAEQEKK